jgi:hypothetical protein
MRVAPPARFPRGSKGVVRGGIAEDNSPKRYYNFFCFSDSPILPSYAAALKRSLFCCSKACLLLCFLTIQLLLMLCPEALDFFFLLSQFQCQRNLSPKATGRSLFNIEIFYGRRRKRALLLGPYN